MGCIRVVCSLSLWTASLEVQSNKSCKDGISCIIVPDFARTFILSKRKKMSIEVVVAHAWLNPSSGSLRHAVAVYPSC